ncbi:MAG TPA: DUF6184 family natural product biosynthesis lipoprotein [Myxococcaceae bacterium]|nr:DUF6184 family natural product biosynthesis lipoprotein [Myxococcaceae bacterium]
MRSLLLIPVLLSLTACGNTLSRTDAINEAAHAACDFYARCDQIGAEQNDAYPNRDECVTEWRSTFQSLWTFDACEDNINPDGFDACITRLEIMQCSNVLDLISALGSCTQGNVCGGQTN